MARPIPAKSKAVLWEFVNETVAPGATMDTEDTDALASYRNLLADVEHKAVKHSVGQYIDGMAHTQDLESFWAMLKRGYKGTLPQDER